MMFHPLPHGDWKLRQEWIFLGFPIALSDGFAQIRKQLMHGPVAVGGSFFQGLADYLVILTQEFYVKLSRLLLKRVLECLEVIPSVVRMLSGEHLVEDNADAEDIGTFIGRFAAKLFGGDIPGGAGD